MLTIYGVPTEKDGPLSCLAIGGEEIGVAATEHRDECEEQARRGRLVGCGSQPAGGNRKELVAVGGWAKHSCGMKRMLCSAAILLPVFAPNAAVPGQAGSGDAASRNDQKLADYFRAQIGRAHV